MTNIEKDGLKKIYLFKSADYQFAEIDLSDNTLLLGESGVGKTTLMRVILFFYTMDTSSSVLNINTESKKRFNQWYFQERNSHIVYEYYKDENPYLFIVSRSSNLHYTFLDMTNSEITVRDLFLEGREPVTLEKLNENIEKHLLPKYHTTHKEKYIRAFHKKDMDGKRIKQESKIDFTLFESMTAREEFSKTLSNIFATSKVSSDSVKKTIVSLIEETAVNINLKNIRESLDDYVKFREQIRRFERQIPKINELKEVVSEYQEKRELFKSYANQVNLLKTQGESRLVELKIEVSRLEDKKEQVKLEYNPKIEQLKNSVNSKDKEIYSEEKEIDKLKIKKDEYQSKNIDALILEYHNKKSYEKSLELYQDRYEALTTNSDEVKERYKKIFEKLEKDRDEALFSIRDEKRVERENISTQKGQVLEKKSEKIEQETSHLLKEKEELNSFLTLEQKTLEKIKIEQAKVENFPYNQEEIGKYQDEIEQFKDELSKLMPEIPILQGEIKSIDREINNHVPIRLQQEKDKLHNNISKKRDKFIEEKEEIEKKLDFDKKNLYGYINKNKIEQRDKLLTFVKDELLFLEKRFSVEKTGDLSSIFGLNIEFEDEKFGFDYNIISLEAELKSLQGKIKEQNRMFQEESQKLEKNAREETSLLNRKRSKFLKEKQEKNYLVEKYNGYITKSQNSLIEANNRAKSMKSEAMNRLSKEFLEQSEVIKELKNKISEISLKIDNIIKSIKLDAKNIIQKLDDELDLLKINEQNSLANINEKYIADKKQGTLEELTKHLEESGVNKQVLDELNNKMSECKSKLKDIEKNFSTVNNYLTEYMEEIKNIPSSEDNLKKEKQLLLDLREALKVIKEQFQLKLSVIDVKFKKLEEAEESLKTFLKKYKNKIENQPIEKHIKNILSLEYNEDVSNILGNHELLSSVIDRLIFTYAEVENKHDAIINKTQIAIKGLDKTNIFKLEIIDNYMEESANIKRYLSVANGLIEYIEKDKISVLKETSSSKFINHLNAITKDIDLFESSLMDIEEKVKKLDNKVKKAVDSFKVIDAIHIKKESSNNEVLEKLKLVTEFYTENSEKFLSGLFSTQEEKEENSKAQNELASKIEELVSLLSSSKEILSLQEGFVLTFTVTENGNRLNPAQTLNDIGSNGTSTLVKTIINISLLQMVNEKSQILNHCILDEIGTISPSYFRELKDYANSSGFLFVNGMPTEDDMLISMYPTVYIGQNHGNYSKMLLATKMVV